MHPNRSKIIGGAVGNVLEWYDFAVFGFLAPFIATQFFPSDDALAGLIKTFGVFAAATALQGARPSRASAPKCRFEKSAATPISLWTIRKALTLREGRCYSCIARSPRGWRPYRNDDACPRGDSQNS